MTDNSKDDVSKLQSDLSKLSVVSPFRISLSTMSNKRRIIFCNPTMLFKDLIVTAKEVYGSNDEITLHKYNGSPVTGMNDSTTLKELNIISDLSLLILPNVFIPLKN